MFFVCLKVSEGKKEDKLNATRNISHPANPIGVGEREEEGEKRLPPVAARATRSIEEIAEEAFD